MLPGRNEPCPCGSNQKFKLCHLSRIAGNLETSTLWFSEDKWERHISARHALSWIHYCRAAYRHDPIPLFMSVVLDFGEAAESLERAAFRLEFTAVRSQEKQVQLVLAETRRQLGAAVSAMHHLRQVLKDGQSSELAAEAVLDWEDTHEMEPSDWMDAVSFSNALLNDLRGGIEIRD